MLGQHSHPGALIDVLVQNLEEIRRAFQNGITLARFRRDARDSAVQQLRLVDHHHFRETHLAIHLFHAAVFQRNTGHFRLVYGVFADVFVRGIQGVEIERLVVNAELARHLFEVQIVLEAQRFLQDAGAVDRTQHQCAVIGYTEIAGALNVQLAQIVLHADIRPPGGQHHVHPFAPRCRDSLLYRRRDLVLRIQQRAVHVDRNQFNSHSTLLPVVFSHANAFQPRLSAPKKA